MDWDNAPSASLFPYHPRGETTAVLNRLPIRAIGEICGSYYSFQDPFSPVSLRGVDSLGRVAFTPRH